MNRSSQSDFISRWTASTPLIATFVHGAVRDFQHAEDLLQEIAQAAFDKFDSFDHSRSFTSWAMGIARNKVALFLRKKYRDPIVLGPGAVAKAADAIEKLAPQVDEHREALAHCMKRLQKRGRAVLEMRYFDQRAVQSIAESIGVTPHAVSMLLYRVRLALRKCIEGQLAQSGDES